MLEFLLYKKCYEVDNKSLFAPQFGEKLDLGKKLVEGEKEEARVVVV